jgi:hypothetical protein
MSNMRLSAFKERMGMALVKDLQRRTLEKFSEHTEAKCTYSIITEPSGTKLLQLDTYGSQVRKLRGKTSQSIRFSQEALRQLKRILTENF